MKRPPFSPLIFAVCALLALIAVLLLKQSSPKNADSAPSSPPKEWSSSKAADVSAQLAKEIAKRTGVEKEEPMPRLRKNRSTITLLAPPDQQGGGVNPFLTEPARGDPLDIVLDYIRDPDKIPNHTEADFANPKLTDRYVSRHNGVTHIYLRQRHQGIEVYNGNLNTNVLPDGRIINLHNDFVPDLASEVNRTVPVISARQAIEHAAGYYKLNPDGSFEPLPVADPDVAAREQLFTPSGISLEPIPAKLNYVALENGPTRLAWNLVIQFTDKVRWMDLNIDAENGTLLSEANWVSSADYKVYRFPLESPNDGGRSIEIEPHNTTASPFGWHDTNGVPGAEFTDTRGNNVNAQEDADDNNTGGTRPSGGSGLSFNFSANLSQAPASYQPAVTTNLFYWNNVIHDVLWHYGFDEQAGNFQENNYGNGGAGSDPVEADSQDGSGTNNANFGTPPDGSNPRMQMYIWTGPNPDRDSSFDNGIIIHEYGHGVSNRLTGGPANASALVSSQSRGMGEGWSDWLALTLTHQVGDTATTARGMGTYVLGQSSTGAGIRPYRYSTSMVVNPQTFGDLARGELSVPHGIGSVWCATLWEVYWALIGAHGYDSNLINGASGNNIALQLVLDGMKLQPSNPTYTEARDAIIMADQVNNGGANFDLLWAAFAKRGLGASAYDGGAASSLAVVEAFDIPDDLEVTPLNDNIFSPGGRRGGPFSPSGRSYTLENTGASSLNWTVSTNVNWLNLSTTSGSLNPSGTSSVLVTLNTNANLLPGGVHVANLNFVNNSSSQTIVRTVLLSINDLGEAVDEPSLTFTSSAPSWFTQSAVTRDGVDAAQAGAITHNQTSAMEVTVTGPDELRFYWKVSSETNFDFLRFRDNGQLISSISGNVDWTEVAYSVPAGTHTLRWEYDKDFSVDTGADTGWVDQLSLDSAQQGPSIISDLSASGIVGVPFQYQIVATKNPTSYSSGTLPGGLSLNTSNGLISGTPTAEGIFVVDITATNAQGSNTESLSIRISERASYPFFENFESGSLSTGWTVSGTGPNRVQVTQDHLPKSGSWHATLDSSTSGSYARNELTLTIDLAGHSNVALQFDAKEFSDEWHGPPAAPFVGGADFDGVAISEDGTNWYEVQPLRAEISSNYTHFTIDLDAAAASRGLTYNSAFFIRFNQYDNFVIDTDGMAFDNISVGPAAPDISVEQPVGNTLLSGASLVTFDDTGTGQQSSKIFTIRNIGTQPLSGLAASITGPDAADYSAAGFGTTVLNPGQATNLEVTITPSALGGRNATLQIASNDPVESIFEIDLTGEGIIPVATAAAFPFAESFETGSLGDFWTVNGTGRHRTLPTQANDPHEGGWHLTMDSSILGADSRNELTLAIDLQGQSNAILQFWAKSFGENLDGPPPAPFVNNADFDGVAISSNGIHWYEVQPLRSEISGQYSEFTVDLAAAAAAHGLTFNSAFRIRFNHYDDSPIPAGGFAFDDIRVGPLRPEISVEQDNGNILTDGISSLDFGEVEVVGQQASRTFVIRNVGLQSLTGLAASFSGATGEFGSPPITPTTLAPGASTSLTVFFDPLSLGMKSATLLIASDDADENPFEVGLTGEGVDLVTASIPFQEDFESGSLAPYWVVSGPGRTVITELNGPHNGSRHLTMDSTTNSSNIRNELTLKVDLAGESGVLLSFWARDFADEPHGPPPIPFTGSGNFDGVAISSDGVSWYEVQPLRSEVSDTYSEFVVDLDAAIAIHGLSYNSAFRIRFNHYDNSLIPIDGLAFDDISIFRELPEIGVEQPAGTNLTDGADLIDFTEVGIGAQNTLNFLVRNTGDATLSGLSASFSGAAAADFSAGSFGATSLPPGFSTNFLVTFAPSAVGQRFANLHIANNDIDENPFDVLLTGVGGNAEIGIEQPAGTDLTDGSSTVDFGSETPGNSSQRTFTIRNHGTSDLTQLAASVTGAGAAEYSVGALSATTLAAGQTATFTVTFSPGGGGARIATLQVASSDLDENPFDIDLTGTGLNPEIEVEQPAGSGLISGTSQVSFGSATQGQNVDLTFTVRNTGVQDLSGLAASFAGLNPGEFSASALGQTTLSPGGSTTFVVSFAPQHFGNRSATLRIANNDANENPFEVFLEAVGVAPEIAVDLMPSGGGSVELSDGADTVDFDDVHVGSSGTRTLRIRNLGTSLLTGLAANFTGAQAADYGAGVFGATTLGPGESTTVDISLNPSAAGIRNTSLEIASNDSDENPFDISLTGEGIQPEITVEQPVATVLSDGAATIDFGSTNIAQAVVRTFTIRNDGTTELNGLAVSLSGPQAGEFSSGALSATALNPGQSATFDVTYLPGNGGGSSADLQIASNDLDENPFDIILVGTALGPEIEVEEPVGTGLESGVSARSFGSVNVGQNGDLTFTIHNSGNQDLSGLAVSFSGLNPTDFSATGPGQTTLAAGGSTTVTVSFAPQATGPRSATMSIASNDHNENPFEITLSGTGVSPEIGVDLVGQVSGGSVLYGSSSTILWQVNKATGAATAIAPLGDLSVTGLGYDPNNQILYGIEVDSDTLVTIDTVTGAVTTVGPLNYGFASSGLAYNSDNNLLYTSRSGGLYSIDPTTGAATLVGTGMPPSSTAMAYDSNRGRLYLVDPSLRQLHHVDPATAQITLIGDLGSSAALSGLAYDPESDTIYLSNPAGYNLYTLDVNTGAATQVGPFQAQAYMTGLTIAPPLSSFTELSDGADTIDFGDVLVGQSKIETLRIRNEGDTSLTGLAASFTGAGAGDYAAGVFGSTVLAPGESTTVEITFSPSSIGMRAANLEIANNDVDENPFDIALTGVGLASDITVEQPAGNDLTDGSSTVDFGQRSVGAQGDLTFTIRNNGNNPLSGLGAVLDGAAAAEYSAGTFGATTLNPGESTTVTVSFAPAATGNRIATMQITNNDPDENPFDVNLTGLGVDPEIGVEQPAGTELTDGGATIDFGDLLPGENSTRTFTVRNTGVSPLENLVASIGGVHAAEYSVDGFGSTTLGPGASTTITVTYANQNEGVRTATLQIASNDADENPFDINLTAESFGLTSLDSYADQYGLVGDDRLPDSDGDGDSITLLEEYAYGLDPTLADSAVMTPGGVSGTPLIRVVNGRLEAEFLRRRDDPNLSVIANFSADLPDGFSPATEPETITNVNVHFDRVVVRDSVGVSSANRRFGKVEVTEIPPP